MECYRNANQEFCPKCTKRLFDGTKIPATLAFAAPKADNLYDFQKHTTHLSISGVQLKYSLRREGSQLVLSENMGEYIIKPIPPSAQLVAIEDAPENEHLTMQIAEQIFKIRTAANGLVYFSDGQPAYITRRFDLKADGTKYQQEDFAQLLNRTSASHGQNYKYDATYEEIGVLIRKHVAAATPALEALFRLVTFNYVVGNGDAHLKNFSLMQLETGEYRPTPAYDLVCTKLHTPYESDIALELYDGCLDAEFYGAYGYYGRLDFMEFANRLGIVPKRASAIFDGYIKQQEQVTDLIQRSLLSQESKRKYIAIVNDRLNRIRS
ncbi:serine/threonine-protein kinase HipA [Dyadobacter soli]|uniref:Serine/threonine-protein kinase HipA n=1 Tax=Dyadobacter soli TaxID=659014 RepID=A0A1G7GG91_9BACT|nr:serine/threonine-protein kinase HipA [Dyadobacter soli]